MSNSRAKVLNSMGEDGRSFHTVKKADANRTDWLQFPWYYTIKRKESDMLVLQICSRIRL